MRKAGVENTGAVKVFNLVVEAKTIRRNGGPT